MKRIHIKSEPINIAKLIKSIGYKKAADSLGITAPAIKRYIKMGKAPKSTEMAAESVIGKQSLSISNNDITAIIKADPHVIEIVRKVVENNNGTYSKLTV